MKEAMRKVYMFIWVLRLRIKLMTEKDFLHLLETLDSGTALYALTFRYL